MLIDPEPGPYGGWRGHVARANAVWNERGRPPGRRWRFSWGRTPMSRPAGIPSKAEARARRCRPGTTSRCMREGSSAGGPKGPRFWPRTHVGAAERGVMKAVQEQALVDRRCAFQLYRRHGPRHCRVRHSPFYQTRRQMEAQPEPRDAADHAGAREGWGARATPRKRSVAEIMALVGPATSEKSWSAACSRLASYAAIGGSGLARRPWRWPCRRCGGRPPDRAAPGG